MNTDAVKSDLERVAQRMVEAGWLASYGFTADAGHSVAWKSDGAQKVLFLRELSEKFGLAADDAVPHHFHRACKGQSLPPGVGFPVIDIEVTAFWLLCVEELRLGHDAEGLRSMVHMVTRWGPGADSTVPA